MKGKLSKKDIALTHVLLPLASILLAFVTAVLYTGGFDAIVDEWRIVLSLAALIYVSELIYFFYIVLMRYKKPTTSKDLFIAYFSVFIAVTLSLLCMRYIDGFSVALIVSGVMTAVLIGKNVGIVTNIFTAAILLLCVLLGGVITRGAINGGVILGVILSMIAGFCAVFIVKRCSSRMSLTWGTILAGLGLSPVAMLCASIYDAQIKSVLMSGLWFVVGTLIAIAVFTALLPLFESIFNVWTDFKYAEACSVSQPLLRRLSEEAPGTFNHSLIVSNIAESCAVAIGVNAYLAKAAALYHDVGKLKNPDFFVENQKNFNPHDDLIPELSAAVIKRHTSDGYALLKENNMPEEILRIALEHHGTTPVKYFYMKAQDITEGKLDISNYLYENPRPTSKISAIIMLADSAEAASRAHDTSIEDIVELIIKDKENQNQFADCDITFKDLKIIKDTIIKVIPAIYHKRIAYKAG